jgi:hypothetical protein
MKHECGVLVDVIKQHTSRISLNVLTIDGVEHSAIAGTTLKKHKGAP